VSRGFFASGTVAFRACAFPCLCLPCFLLPVLLPVFLLPVFLLPVFLLPVFSVLLLSVFLAPCFFFRFACLLSRAFSCFLRNKPQTNRLRVTVGAKAEVPPPHLLSQNLVFFFPINPASLFSDFSSSPRTCRDGGPNQSTEAFMTVRHGRIAVGLARCVLKKPVAAHHVPLHQQHPVHGKKTAGDKSQNRKDNHGDGARRLRQSKPEPGVSTDRKNASI